MSNSNLPERTSNGQSDLEKLQALEAKVQSHGESTVAALNEIRDSCYWKVTHRTWDHYLKDRWGMSHQYLSKLANSGVPLSLPPPSLPESPRTPKSPKSPKLPRRVAARDLNHPSCHDDHLISIVQEVYEEGNHLDNMTLTESWAGYVEGVVSSYVSPDLEISQSPNHLFGVRPI